jgi:pSer/pThr/pTyr-binding forkhead associated (FHA) protein
MKFGGIHTLDGISLTKDEAGRDDGTDTLRYGRMWILQSAEAEVEPLTFRVKPGAIKTVGRAPRADFIVEAALVSRLHCRLEVTDDRIDVIDLASTNGTFVNGKRIERARLHSGDLLQVGRVALKVERLPGES